MIDPTLAVPRSLLYAFVDTEPCHFDHHGGCQAHGSLDLEPGETCPQAQLKTLLNLDPRGAPLGHELTVPMRPDAEQRARTVVEAYAAHRERGLDHDQAMVAVARELEP